MDNFLTELFLNLFELRKREGDLMSNHTFKNDNETIRNDQSISCIRREGLKLEKLIESYLSKNGFEK